MSLRGYLGAINSMLIADYDDIRAELQVQLIENLISTSRESGQIDENQSPFKDGYRTWVSKRDNGTLNQEVSLYEGYVFFYIAQFLYYSKQKSWYANSKLNQKRWMDILAFVENNIWTKWYERCLPVKGNHYWYFLRGRTHMGSHWAGVAMYLHDLSQNEEIKNQTRLLVDQYDTLLKRNLKIRGRGYVWNSTYDKVEGTYASEVSEDIIQDVSHGNHVVSYIVAAYEFGNPNWSEADISRLAYTLREFVYDDMRGVFRDNVDGTDDPSRPGWGNFVADGWVKLAEYDVGVDNIFRKFKQTNMLRKYNQELQFKSILHEGKGKQ